MKPADYIFGFFGLIAVCFILMEIAVWVTYKRDNARVKAECVAILAKDVDIKIRNSNLAGEYLALMSHFHCSFIDKNGSSHLSVPARKLESVNGFLVIHFDWEAKEEVTIFGYRDYFDENLIGVGRLSGVPEQRLYAGDTLKFSHEFSVSRGLTHLPHQN